MMRAAKVCFLLAMMVLPALANIASADDVAADASNAPDAAALHERILHVAGNPEDPVILLMTVYTPGGPVPFPLAVMNVASDGGWDAASMGPDPVAFALKGCSAHHRNCQLYAVDGDVVWQP